MPEELHLPWLEDYAKFAALHDQYQTDCSQWPKEAVPDPQRMAFHTFLQDIFYQQWFHLKDYANQKGIRIMGTSPSICPATAQSSTSTRSCSRWTVRAV